MLEKEKHIHYLKAEKSYLAEKEVIFLKLDMSNYLIDYYIHLKDNKLQPNAAQDEQLKRLTAALAIYLSLRDPGDTVAWTLHLLAEEPYSLFVTGNAAQKYIIGHVLSENIRHTDVNILHSQVVGMQGESTKSTIQSKSSKVKDVFEEFYKQSEQRPLRIYYPEDSDLVFAITTLPGYDEEWFESVSIKEVENHAKQKLSEYEFQFVCDCSAEKLLPYFTALDEESLNDIYGCEKTLIINCPRCGRNFELTREFVDSSKS